MADVRVLLIHGYWCRSWMAFFGGDWGADYKINAIGNQSKVLSFAALKKLEKGGHLVEVMHIEKGIPNLCVIVNVGRNKLSKIYLATSV